MALPSVLSRDSGRAFQVSTTEKGRTVLSTESQKILDSGSWQMSLQSLPRGHRLYHVGTDHANMSASKAAEAEGAGGCWGCGRCASNESVLPSQHSRTCQLGQVCSQVLCP